MSLTVTDPYCFGTSVSELGPLSACSMLQTLNCSDTGVKEQDPCQHARCCSPSTAPSPASGLGPLTACPLLQTRCSFELLPLQAQGWQAACTNLGGCVQYQSFGEHSIDMCGTVWAVLVLCVHQLNYMACRTAIYCIVHNNNRFIIIKRRSGINPIPPTVIDRD